MSVWLLDDYTRAVYTKPIRLKSGAVVASKTFIVAAENESKNTLREVMTGDMGEVRNIFDEKGIRLSTTVPYHPASNGAERRVLTNVACHAPRFWSLFN